MFFLIVTSTQVNGSFVQKNTFRGACLQASDFLVEGREQSRIRDRVIFFDVITSLASVC
jgi:hypothetical protein